MFCSNLSCDKKTFAETFGFITSNAKTTTRLQNTIINLSINVSSLSTERIIKSSIANVSESTICNLLKKVIEIVDKSSVTQICIDDFAMKKRYMYGTVMIDIDTNKRTDLLDSREIDDLTNWLKTYLNIKMVSSICKPIDIITRKNQRIKWC